MKGRIFKRGVVNHVYQRTRNGDLIFYNISDHLVFFTVFCTVAARHKVQVLKLCQMPDHLHSSMVAERKEDLSGFIREYTTVFSKEHNRTCHREGAFFQVRFGSAVKRDPKLVRTNLIYVDNNPVERHLCQRAEQYQWNYLAYAASNHPFSEPYCGRTASNAMKRAVRVVKSRHAEGRYLSYALLQQLFKSLLSKERKQLADIIVRTYSIIDHAAAIQYFGSYEQMLTADHSTTGSEYDLGEVFVGKDDRWYARLVHRVMDRYHPSDIHDILALPEARRLEMLKDLEQHSNAPVMQIAKFLRLPWKTVIDHMLEYQPLRR